MDSDKLEQLKNLMREAREPGELESTLAAASVFPMPKRPNHKNVPLAEDNRAVLAMAKPEAAPKGNSVPAPKLNPLLATVTASSSAPPIPEGQIPKAPSVQAPAGPMNSPVTQGMHRMRLAHERGDPPYIKADAELAAAKAAIYRSTPGFYVDRAMKQAVATPVEPAAPKQVVTPKPWQPGPGYQPCGLCHTRQSQAKSSCAAAGKNPIA